MEFFDLACAVDEAVCVIPSVIWVMAFPFSLVLKHTVLDSAGEDAGHGIFRLSVDLSWWRRWFSLTRQWVHCCFMKPVSTKYVTHLHVLREVQDVGISVHFKDLEGAGVLVIKLSTGPVSRPTFTGEVDEISDPKVWFTAVLIGLLALTLLGLLKVLSDEFHGIISSFSELLCFLTC